MNGIFYFCHHSVVDMFYSRIDILYLGVGSPTFILMILCIVTINNLSLSLLLGRAGTCPVCGCGTWQSGRRWQRSSAISTGWRVYLSPQTEAI